LRLNKGGQLPYCSSIIKLLDWSRRRPRKSPTRFRLSTDRRPRRYRTEFDAFDAKTFIIAGAVGAFAGWRHVLPARTRLIPGKRRTTSIGAAEQDGC